MTSKPTRDRLVIALVTAGGAGLAPFAPGTCGTVVAALLHLCAMSFDLHHVAYTIGAAIVATAISIALTPAGQRVLGAEDPGAFVLDEVAGYFVAVSFAWPASGALDVLVAFLAFRFFDIAKPPPIRKLEALGGWLGITVDDLMAGVYAGLVVFIFRNAIA